jgi:hypothetical protein
MVCGKKLPNKRIRDLRPGYYGFETDTIQLLLLAAYIMDRDQFSELKAELISNNCYADRVEYIGK